MLFYSIMTVRLAKQLMYGMKMYKHGFLTSIGKKEAYPTISISGGDDAKNVELINWLYDHADLIG